MRVSSQLVFLCAMVLSAAALAQTSTTAHGDLFPHAAVPENTSDVPVEFLLSGSDAEYDGLELFQTPPTPSVDRTLITPERLSFDAAAVRDLPFGLNSIHDPALLHFLEFYVTEGRPRMTQWLSRAGRYRSLVEPMLLQEGLPAELFWVIAIESSFDPDAVSRVGATGLWQFMTRTARQYGLTIESGLDERRDPVRATQAAIAYFKDLHELFASWPLALAAYNAGHGHVRSELRQGNTTNFWRLADYQAVYGAARRYALRATTIAIIDRNRRVFGYENIVPESPLEFEMVDVPGGTRLSLLAEALQMSVTEVRALNPALTGTQTPSSRELWALRIPAGKTSDFVNRFDRLASRYGARHQTVTLRFGETVGDVATAWGVPERVLRSVNGIAYNAPSPYGSELIIPGPDRRLVEPPAVTDLQVVVPALRFDYANQQRVFYQTRPGDTLNRVADHFGLTPWQVAAWNDLDPDAALLSGLTLQLYVAPDFDLSRTVVLRESQVQVLMLGSAEWQAAQVQEQEQQTRSHTVRRGDTVEALAARYGVRARDIIRWNNLGDEAMIIVGQRLVIRR